MAEWRERGYVPDSDDEDEDEVASHFPQKEAVFVQFPEASVAPTFETEPESSRQSTSGHEASQGENVSNGMSPIEGSVPPGLRYESTADKLQAQLENCLRTVHEVLKRPNTPTRDDGPGHSDSSSPLSSIGSMVDFSSLEQEPRLQNAAPNQDDDRIPSQIYLEEAESRHAVRDLRQRNPIQLHPYAIEQAMYQQTWKARGLQPVRVPVGSIDRSKALLEGESRDPKTYHSSQPPSSSPLISSQDVSQSPIGGRRLPLSQWNVGADEDLPDVSSILRGEVGTPAEWSRPRTSRGCKQLQTVARKPRSPRFNMYDLPTDDFGVSEPADALFDVPPSPPQSDRIVVDIPRTGPIQTTRRSFTPHELPSPVHSSSILRKRSAIEISSSSGSSQASETESVSSPPRDLSHVGNRSDNFQQIKRKIKGVLPASWLKLDLKKQVRKRDHRAASRSPVKASDGRGIAQRVSTKRATSGVGTELMGDSMSEGGSEVNVVIMSTTDHEQPLRDAYCSDADDVSNVFMDDIIEDDRVDTMAPSGSRARSQQNVRKRQTRIDPHWLVSDGAGSGATNKSTGRPAPSGLSKRRTRPRVKRKSKKQRKEPSLPQLSVLDAPGFIQMPSPERPRFLRLAGRSARRQTVASGQNPDHKFFRLASREDTADINESLADWRTRPLKHNQFQCANGTRQTAALPVSAANPLSLHNITKEKSDDDLAFLKKSTATTLQNISSRQQGSPIRRKAFHSSLQPSKAPSLTLRALFPTRRSHHNRSGAGSLLRFTIAPRIAQLEEPVTAVADRTVRVPRTTLLDPGNRYGKVPFSSLAKPHSAKANMVHPPNGSSSRLPINKNVRKSQPKQQPRTRLNILAAEEEDWNNGGLAFTKNLTIRSIELPSSPIDRITSTAMQMAIERIKPMMSLPLGTIYASKTPNTVVSNELLSWTSSRMRRPSMIFGHYGTPTAIGNPQTGEIYLWADWNEDMIGDFIAVFGGLYTQLQTLIMSPTHDVPVYLRCMSTLEAIIAWANNFIHFDSIKDRSAFLKISAEEIRTLVSRLTAIVPIPGSHGEYSRLQALNRLTLILFQHSSLAAIESVAKDVKIELQTLFETSMQLCLSSALSPNGQDCLGKFLEKSQDVGKEYLLNLNSPEIDAIIIVRHLSESRYADAWPMVFNQALVEVLNEANCKCPVEALINIINLIACMCPFMQLNQVGRIVEGAPPNTEYDGWSYLLPAVDGCLKQFSRSKDVKTRLTRSFGLHVFSWLYDLVTRRQWTKPEALAKILIRNYNANNMMGLFNHPVRQFTTSFPAFLENMGQDTVPELDYKTDSDFEICLKLIKVTLQQKVSAEGLSIASDKRMADRMRSFVFALCPNIGDTLKGDQSLAARDLISLVNRCSLYLVLYCGAPEDCKPRLSQIEHLTDLAQSHESVWKIMLGTWTRLVKYHVRSELKDTTLIDFSRWIQAMVMQMTDKHKAAYDEVMLQLTRTGDALHHAAQDVINANQNLVTRFLVQIFHNWGSCLAECPSALQAQYLVTEAQDYNIMSLCLVSSKLGEDLAIAVLQLVRGYLCKATSDQLLDYVFHRSDSLKAVLLDRLESTILASDDLLKELTACWFVAAEKLVEAGLKHWLDFLDPHGALSWERLSDTELSRQCKAYFLALYIDAKPSNYLADETEILSYWLGRLVVPTRCFKFEYDLTRSIFTLHTMRALVQERANTTELFTKLASQLSNNNGIFVWPLEESTRKRLSLIRHFIRLLSESGRTLPASLRSPFLGSLTNAMKETWRKLQTNPAEQSEYTRMIYLIIDDIELYVPNHIIDQWYISGQELPERPEVFLNRFRSLPNQPNPQVSTKMVEAFRRNCMRALSENTLSEIGVDMAYAFLCYDPDVVYDIPLQTRFCQNVLSAYVEFAFSTPGYILAAPILEALACVTDKLRTRSPCWEPSHMVDFAKSTSSLVVASRKCMQGIDPHALRESAVLYPVFNAMLHYLHFGLLQYEQINISIPHKEVQNMKENMMNHARYFYAYAYHTLSDSAAARVLDPVAAGVLDPTLHLPNDCTANFGLVLNDAKQSVADGLRIKEHAHSDLESWLRQDWQQNPSNAFPALTDQMERQLMHDEIVIFLGNVLHFITGQVWHNFIMEIETGEAVSW